MGVYVVTESAFTLDNTAIHGAMSLVALDGGGRVELHDPGVYVLPSALAIPANTTFYIGAGVVLKRGFTGDGYLISNGGWGAANYTGPGNVHIEGRGEIDAASTVSTDGTGGVIFANAENVSISGVTVRNCNRWHAVEFHAITRGKARDVTATGFTNDSTSGWWAAEAFQIDVSYANTKTECRHIVIDGCEAWGFGKLAGTHASYASKPCRDIRITNNYAYGTHHAAVGGENWGDVVVADNVFENCNGAVEMTIPALDSDGVAHNAHCKNFTVSGNTVRSSGTINQGGTKKAGSVLFTSSATVDFYGITVVGNNLMGSNTYGVRTVGANDVAASSNGLSGFTTNYSIA